MFERGNSQKHSRGRRQEKQGNLQIKPTAALRTKDSGRLGNESVNAASEVKSRGNSKVHQACVIRCRRFGETRRSGNWHCQRREQRGDSKLKPMTEPDGVRSRSDLGRDHQPEPEGSRGGVTCSVNRRRYRRTESRGNSEFGLSAPPKDVRAGATRSSIAGQAGRIGMRGNPSFGAAGVARRSEKPGQPGDHANRQRLRHARFGDTRNSIAGTANGLKGRGNSQLRRRRGKRALKAGQPEDAWRAKPDASGTGGTRSLIDRPKGR